MACYHPLTAFWTGNTTDAGKRELVIVHGDTRYLDITSPSIPRRIRSTIKPIGEHIKHLPGGDYLATRLELPCGHCLGCRLDYSRQWAQRCMLEAKQWNENIFLTLTYDDDHLRSASLIPEDLTKFMKDLRRQWKYHYNIDNIRFYACGEYGELYSRPHFHLILFNCPVPDKKFFSAVGGTRLWTSEHISRVWDKGFITIGDVTYESAAYVARYVLKKRYGTDADDYYKALGVVPEFVRMSRRPGIAREWFEQNKDKIYVNDELFLSDGKGHVRKLKPCRYFDKIYDNYDPEQLRAIKEQRRKVGETSRRNKMIALGIADRNDYLAREEELAGKRVSNIARAKIKSKEAK